MAKISAKQKRFCVEYMKDSNGAQAAIRAGYSPKTARSQASDLLTTPNVKAHLSALQAKVESKAIMSAQETLAEISLLGRMDSAHFVHVEKDGVVRMKGFGEMPAGATRCIRKIKLHSTSYKADDGKMVTKTTTELELWSKETALDMMGRHRALFTGKGEDDKPVTVNITYSEAQKPAKAST